MNSSEAAPTVSENILSLRSTEIVVFESTLIILIDLIAFIGNLLICLAIFRNTRLHTVTNIYILALAISDTLMAGAVMPLSSGVIITGHWLYGDVMCGIQGFTLLVLSWVALQTIALTAVNRYFRVVKPASYRNWFTVNSSVSMVIGSWFVVLLLVALPPLCGWADFSFKAERAICFISFPNQYIAANITFTALHLTLFVVLTFFTVLICYWKIYWVVKRHKESSQQIRILSLNMSVEEIRISRTLFSITIGYFIIWVPVVIVETLHTLYGHDLFPRGIYLVYTYLWYGSSIVNPLVYGYMNRTFRKEARRVFPVSRKTYDDSLEKLQKRSWANPQLIAMKNLQLWMPNSEKVSSSIRRGRSDPTPVTVSNL